MTEMTTTTPRKMEDAAAELRETIARHTRTAENLRLLDEERRLAAEEIDALRDKRVQLERELVAIAVIVPPRPKLTREEAGAVLADYPDADLSAFDVEGGDVEELAAEVAARRIEKIEAKADEFEKGEGGE